jgi:hypothetical protein
MFSTGESCVNTFERYALYSWGILRFIPSWNCCDFNGEILFDCFQGEKLLVSKETFLNRGRQLVSKETFLNRGRLLVSIKTCC